MPLIFDSVFTLTNCLSRLEHIEGDWHEFESKALRKEARRAEYQNQKEREKRKAEASMSTGDRDSKRTRQEAGQASGDGHIPEI